MLPAQAPPRAGRPAQAPHPHPFAAAPDVLADSLADALAGIGTGDLPRKAVDGDITLRLPSAPDGPLASPELLIPPVGAIETPRTRRVSLAAWRVPVLVFAPAAASALAALAELPPGDIVTSGSIGYLAAVVRIADDLAARRPV